MLGEPHEQAAHALDLQSTDTTTEKRRWENSLAYTSWIYPLAAYYAI